MTKAKHNKILEDLLVQTQLGNFREDIILMTVMMAADFQIQLMQKINGRAFAKASDIPAFKSPGRCGGGKF